MPKFRKKPVVIEAVQWAATFEKLREITAWGCPGVVKDIGKESGTGALYIQTLEGVMRCDVDDWIIKGVKGEFYPCKPDIFAATYEPA
jgi:hypothetical protein